MATFFSTLLVLGARISLEVTGQLNPVYFFCSFLRGWDRFFVTTIMLESSPLLLKSSKVRQLPFVTTICLPFVTTTTLKSSPLLLKSSKVRHLPLLFAIGYFPGVNLRRGFSRRLAQIMEIGAIGRSSRKRFRWSRTI